MLIGVISVSEPMDGSVDHPCAMLPVLGRPLADHQVQMLLAAGASRIICVVQSIPGQVMAIKQRVEAHGRQFVLARNAAETLVHIGQDDRAIIMGEGLIPDAAMLASLTQPGKPVVVTLAEADSVPGLERIDMNHHWAGLMAASGRDLAAMANLPGDWSFAPAALRHGLQQQFAREILDGAVLRQGRLLPVRSDAQAHQAENALLARASEQTEGGNGPITDFLAGAVIGQGAPLLLSREDGPVWATATGGGLLLGAMLAAANELPVTSLLLNASGALALVVGLFLLRTARHRLIPRWAMLAADSGLAVCLAVLLGQAIGGSGWNVAIYLSVTAMALAALIRQFGRKRRRPARRPLAMAMDILTDRVALPGLLAAGAVTGFLQPLVMLVGFALLIVLAGMLFDMENPSE